MVDFLILTHTSKTMKSDENLSDKSSTPFFQSDADYLGQKLAQLSIESIESAMHVSRQLAEKTKALSIAWANGQTKNSVAVRSFSGDIYSGLRADDFDQNQMVYAQEHLRILSGLYGILRPLDSIRPYRLEMGYSFPDPAIGKISSYWKNKVASALPETGTIVNVSSVEYMKVVLPFIDSSRVITPKFMTLNPKTHKYVFTAVHAKIARGAFARWLIQTRTQDVNKLMLFDDLGYKYNPVLSTPLEPVFVCEEFGGLGLSIRTS